MKWWMLALLSGCVVPVSATGFVSHREPETWLMAANLKERELVGPEVARIRWLDGLLVEVEGTFRRGRIEVDAWNISEGPLGFGAFVGVVDLTAGGPVLRIAQTREVLGLHGEGMKALADERGQWVLVEGIVDGPLRVRVMGWRPLHGPLP